MNRVIKNTNPITVALRSGLTACTLALLAACTQGPGGNGIGVASGQDPDPATVDFPVFYIRHQIPEDQDQVTRLRPFVEDDDYTATLWKRDRASPGSTETNLTARLATLPGADPADRYDIKDLDVSPDGLKVAFAMRGPLDDIDDEDEPPTWNIWEYNIATDTLHRVISSNIIAEEGQDVAPAYLPDGRIVFSSTRQRQSKAILLDEGKTQFEAANEARGESAFVLHVMNGDGTNIHQISFNPSNDLDPTVLQDGRVLFTRWDLSVGDGLNLYTMNPDGTDMQLLYGALSHLTGTNNTSIEFLKAREMANGSVMVLIRPRTNVDFGGNLNIVDTNTYVENTQPVLASAGMRGPAQRSATLNNVETTPGPSEDGRFNSGFPLWDGSGRILVSYSQCRLLDTVDPTRIVPCTDARLNATPAPTAAPPLYSIWMFNPAQNTMLPVMTPVEGVMVIEAVAAQPRLPLPRVILDKQAPLDLDPDLVSEGAGVLSIRSVYDITGVGTRDAAAKATIAANIAAISNPASPGYATRQIRFIRAEKRVSIPDDDDIADPDNSAFGRSGGVMREILSYAPVEPDGSVRMKIPANVAFQLSMLDVNGRRVNNLMHRAWLQVRPGEVLECDGCHIRAGGAAALSHGRKGLFDSAYAGATTTGGAFPGTANSISPEAGDTMASARLRVGSSCIDATTMAERCGRTAIVNSANVVYDEIWMPSPAPTASFAYRYQDLQGTASPASVNCFPVWNPTCRITIHYATIGTRVGHIHPLWNLPRPVGGVDDGLGNITYPDTCNGCHSRVDPADPAVARVPDASLDLTDAACNAEPMHEEAYCELFNARDLLVLDNGAVVTAQSLVPLDANGQPTSIVQQLPPSMAGGDARGSRFFAVMNNATHAGMLSPAELRLISEWLDIGAQYYNDPFPPTPQN